MHYFLIFLALLAAVAGIFMLTEATLGIGVIAMACFLGILARITQAGSHQNELKRELKSIRQPSTSNHD